MTLKYRRARWIIASVTFAALTASCAPQTAGPSQRTITRDSRLALPARVKAGQFISVRFVPKGRRNAVEVAVSSARTGAVVRRLLSATDDGMTVNGLSVDRSGDLWITYSEGPVYQNDLAGGDPKPHSCANEIVVLHHATGLASVFLRTGNDIAISGAAISPDGRTLAYDESGCATGYLNNYLRITRVATKQSWTIGRALQRCHFLTNPAWTLDSRALAVSYSAHTGPAYTGPQGTCGGFAPGRLVELSPAAQPGLSGRSAAPAKGCGITSAAPAAGGGLLAIQACGAKDHTNGPAWLLVFGADLRLLRQIPLGRCTDGNDLGTARTGRSVLVSAYMFCNPPGRPGPVTKLWSYSDGRLRFLTSVPGGNLAVSHIAW
ncbi:MAG TPA: hypothetical protein VFQ44_29735 [Streptosporangiaceae bacterium]|nr:hypothetical protein [Streptosporangiaceae bacterium]